VALMRIMKSVIAAALLGWAAAIVSAVTPGAALEPQTPGRSVPAAALFQVADECVACHNGLTTASGEDVSIGVSWRASMMANASRDPYWHAAVRRETIDHPEHAPAIEQECAVCHMPMAHTQALAEGRRVEVFANLFNAPVPGPDAVLAAEGVSCTMCHQIRPDKLGTRESFNGGFVVDRTTPVDSRAIFGPYAVDPGRSALMRSATGFVPTESLHVRESSLCATCHTLYTKALGPGGKVVGELPEQVPYLEWQHSAWKDERSCQSCHMPRVAEPMAITSVAGQPREGMARHGFIGGNFFMLGLLNRYRAELGVPALPQELDAARRATVRFLQTETATLDISYGERSGDQLSFDVTVRNLSGHKFPTAYPSRRAWLHVIVRDSAGRVLLESGTIEPNGAIAGNDNDADGSRFERHHMEIRSSADVQIYESIMVDHSGAVTTGLLSGVRFAKDNRLLPRGFDKERAHPDVAVHGIAAADEDFTGGSDRVRYSVSAPAADGAVTVEAVLRYQPIGFRWARALERYDAPEPRRFVNYFNAAASGSSEVIARATQRADGVIGRP
jgi:hypothetical protein